jgi:hypothetical protein
VVSGQLEDSLRREVEAYIEGRLSSIRQELQNELNQSLNQVLDRQSDMQLDGSIAATILEHLRAAHEEGIDLAATESARAKASSDMAIVKAAISDIDEQRSQAEILKMLVNRAASFAPRVAFFVIKGEQASGWRARGFQGTVGDEAISQISFAVSADTVVGDAANSRNTWSGDPTSHNENYLLLGRLGEEPPQRIVAIPLVVRERTVAVLYADSAGLDSEAINLEALETLVRVSGMAVELLAGRSTAAKREQETVASAPAMQEETSAYVPSREYEAPAAEEIPEPSSEMAPEPAPEFSESTYDSAPVADSWPQAEPEPVVQEAAPEVHSESFESQPSSFDAQPQSFESESPDAGLLSEPALPVEPAAPQSTRKRYGMDMELPVDVSSDEERRLHQDARRFARLLVSEIKLYNEQKVVDGRSNYDLYERLREYIDRSREMYDKRVKPEVARKYDYFHHELVNTLAEGEAEKLGNAYPGATVAA